MPDIRRLPLDSTDPLGIALLIGPDDPSGVAGGVSAPKGSPYIRETNGQWYTKFGPGNNEWAPLATSSGYLPLAGGDLTATAVLGWTGRSKLYSPADGIITATSNAGSGFQRFNLGGDTVAFPSLRRNGAQLDLVTADASAWAVLNAHSLNTITGGISSAGGITAATGNIVATAGSMIAATSGSFIWNGRSRFDSPSDGVIKALTNTGALYADLHARDLIADRLDGTGVIYFSAATNRYLYYDGANYQLPGGGLSVGSYILAGSYVQIPSASVFNWTSRSAIGSGINGAISLTNSAGTDFTILSLGPYNSASFPALRVSGLTVEIVTSDQAAYASLKANSLTAVGGIVVSGGSSTMSLNGLPLTIIRNTSAGVALQVTNDTTYAHVRLTSGGTNQNAYLTFNPTGTGVAAFQVSDNTMMYLTVAGVLVPQSTVMPASGVTWTSVSWVRQFGLIDGGAIAYGFGGGANKRWLTGSSGGQFYFGHVADDGVGTPPSYVMTLSPAGAGIVGAVTISSTLDVTGVLSLASHLVMAQNFGIYHTAAGNDYTTAALMLRERGAAGPSAEAPRLAFHYGSVVASQISIEKTGTNPWTSSGVVGRLAVISNPGTGYADLAANSILAVTRVTSPEFYDNVSGGRLGMVQVSTSAPPGSLPAGSIYVWVT